MSQGSNDETLELRTHGNERRVLLVDGNSEPQIKNEIQRLLQCRIRLASLVMCGAFTVFAIYSWGRYFFGSPSFDFQFATLELIVTAILGICGFSLCRKKVESLTVLRLKELLVFGLPALFFGFYQLEALSDCARKGFLPSLVPPWTMLMFVYAFFIPNDWKRAAAVIGAMALAPITIMVFALVTDSYCRSAINFGAEYVITTSLILATSAVISVIGVRTIRVLRREAFEAKQVGQYRLKKLLGRGGMGDVYLAEHRLMRRPCVVKVIRAERAGDPRALARFEREVQATATLTHWNSIEVFDYGRADDGTFFYVMEYLPGMNLQELVDRYGPMPASRCAHFLLQTCDALAEAHGRGLIHRDIKPANIFAAERGGIWDVAKLLDFGLVKPLIADADKDVSMDGSITGSPAYMAPEQAMSVSEPDCRSDIYALGAVAYFLVTARPPFDEPNPLKLIFAHANENVVPPSQWCSDLPADFEQVLMKCLEKSPDDRFQNVYELQTAIRACACSQEWTRQDAAEWWRRVRFSEKEAPRAIASFSA